MSGTLERRTVGVRRGVGRRVVGRRVVVVAVFLAALVAGRLVAAPGLAATATDERLGLTWELADGRLRVTDGEDAPLGVLPAPWPERQAVHLLAIPGSGTVWGLQGRALIEVDGAGRIVRRTLLPIAGAGLRYDGEAARLWVLGDSEALAIRLDTFERLAPQTLDRQLLAHLAPRGAAAPAGTAAASGRELAEGLWGGFEAIDDTGGIEPARPQAPALDLRTGCAQSFVPGLAPGSEVGLASAPGYSTSVATLTAFDDGSGVGLYAAGYFQYAGGQRVDGIARWTGAGWERVGAGFNQRVNALLVFDDGSGPALYAAGNFSAAGSLAVNGIARWDGRRWQRVGYGFNDWVRDLAVVDDGTGPHLFAAGDFSLANHGSGWFGGYQGITANGLARWNGERWEGVGSPDWTHPQLLRVLGSQLFVGLVDRVGLWSPGGFTEVLSTSETVWGLATGEVAGTPGLFASLTSGVMAWNGSSWLGIGAPSGAVDSLQAAPVAPGGRLLARGDFAHDGSGYTHHLASWDGTSWSYLDPQLAFAPAAVAWLAVGGQPTLWGVSPLTVARWAGTDWQALSPETTDFAVQALAPAPASLGGGVFLGGRFTRLGSTPANRVARLDATGGIEPLGGGLDGWVQALLWFDDGNGPALFAGGTFTHAGGQSASHVARWDGQSWSPLGSGLGDPAWAFAVFDDGSGPALYAATGASSYCCGSIERWDGSAWTTVATSDAAVLALGVADLGAGPTLFAGGRFTSIDGTSAAHVAELVAGSWQPLGSGTSAAVRSLVGDDQGGLYVGGDFVAAGGAPALRLARWNGGSWSAVGSGLGSSSFSSSETVNTLAFFDDGSGPVLFAGGGFSVAGGLTVRNLARLSGSSWSEAGGGVDAPVSALLPASADGAAILYLAGSFLSPGGVPSRFFAGLTTPLSCPADALVVESPLDGLLTSQAALSVQGFTTQLWPVWVNQRRALAGPDLHFSLGPLALVEGSNRFLVEADRSGHSTLTSEVEVFRDSGPPSIEWLAPAEGSKVFSSRPLLKLAFADTGSAVDPESLAFLVDGLPILASCTGHAQLAVCAPLADLADGQRSLTASVQDLAGNRGDSVPLSLTVQAEPPPRTTTVVGSVVDGLGAGVDGAAVEVLGAAAGETSSGGGFTLQDVAVESDHTLTVVARALLGNEPQLGSLEAIPVPGGTTDVGAIALATGCAPQVSPGLFEGAGVSGSGRRVLAMTVFDDGSGPALFVGGTFSRAGGVEAPYVARWNGQAWSAVGGGTDGAVRALTVFDDGSGPALYAGGSFTTAGGVAALHVARWDGSTWAAVGGGVGTTTTGNVYALVSWDDGTGPALYAGGTFTTAGGQSAARVARYRAGSWSPLGSGLASTTGLAAVWALTSFDDGSGAALYAGGVFNTAGGLTARRIARWNGGSWSALGDGVGSGSVDGVAVDVAALAVFDDGSGPALFVGGQFNYAGASTATAGLAKWQGGHWWAVGRGLSTGGILGQLTPQGVQALAVFDAGTGPRLYAAGDIQAAGGSPTAHLVAWDGVEWRSVESGLTEGGVGGMALAVYTENGQSRLFVGGSFDDAGPEPVGGIARWDGQQFSAVGSGTDGAVRAWTVFDDGTGPALYAAGDFLRVGGTPARRIARFDGQRWTAVGEGLHDTVLTLAVFDDGGGPRLYAGGEMSAYGANNIDGVAVWTAQGWQEVGGGLTGNGPVRAFAVFDDGQGPRLYATGGFNVAGSVAASRLARWDGSSWSAVGSGLNGEGWALQPWDDGGTPVLVVGGSFSLAGGVAVSNLARLHAGSWSALGEGLLGTVKTLAVVDLGGGPQLYAGGSLATSTNPTGHGVARWDGTHWSGLGVGVDAVSPEVDALAAFDDGRGTALYAAGAFTSAGGLPAANVARWDGSSWSPLGAGADGPVRTLIRWDDGGGAALYLGGEFGAVDGVLSPFVARWRAPLSCAAEQRWDLTPPLLSFLAPAAGSLLVDPLVELVLAATDERSGVDPGTLTWASNRGSFAAACTWTPPELHCLPVTELAEGATALSAFVLDRAGNRSLPAALTLTVDTQPPTISFTSPPAGATVSTTQPALQLAVSDASSGVATTSLEVELAGGPLAVSCTFAGTTANCIPAQPLPTGTVALRARIADQAGHLSSWAERSFIVPAGAAPDTVAPVVAILEPLPATVFDPNLETIRLVLGDIGQGVDRTAIHFDANGTAVVAACEVCGTGATCRLSSPISSDAVLLGVTVADLAGNVSRRFTVRFATHPGVDLDPPGLTLLEPVPGLVTAQQQQLFRGELSEPATLTLDGAPISVAADLSFVHGPVALATGLNAFLLRAVDASGNETVLEVPVTLDPAIPAPVDASKVAVSPSDHARVTVTGAAGAAVYSPGAQVRLRREINGNTTTTALNPDGSFVGSLTARGGDRLAVLVAGANGLLSEPRFFQVPGTPDLPSDPATVAPLLSSTVATDFCAATAFLTTGADAIQPAPEPLGSDCRRSAVIRGRVLDSAGNGLAGALVAAAGQAQLGDTLSRADGRFDLVVLGGGRLRVLVRKEGYYPLERGVDAPWSDYATLDDVVLTPRSAVAATLSVGTTAAAQLATGPSVSDADGTRQTTLLVPAGTQAYLETAGGGRQELASFTFRSTEYTVGPLGPLAMPAPLPARSGYTYAVELAADEAEVDRGESLRFSQPVVVYTDNFLGFSPGLVVPSAYFDRQAARWVPSENGRVMAVLGLAGSLAELDLDGSGQPAAPAALAELGIDAAEQEAIAGRFAAGTSFWRVRVTHFTPWDFNFPVESPPGSTAPGQPAPRGGDQDKRPCDEIAGGSIIECTNQILGEVLPLTGTGFTLHYASDRVPGRKIANRLEVPLSGPLPPAGLKRIELKLDVAGQTLTQVFPPGPDQEFSFDWDGRDGYGRQVQGRQRYQSTVSYVYDAEYRQPERCELGPCFGQSGAEPIGPARLEMRDTQSYAGRLGTWNALDQERLGGWTISAHHAYDPADKTLYLGDGTRREIREAKVIRSLTLLPSNGAPGAAADDGRLFLPADMELAPPVRSAGNPAGSGGYYIVDTGHCKVKMVRWDGSTSTVMGAGGCGVGRTSEHVWLDDALDGLPATTIRLFNPSDVEADLTGNLYVTDFANYVFGEGNSHGDWIARLYRISPDGETTVMASWGTGALIRGLTVDAFNDVYFGAASGPLLLASLYRLTSPGSNQRVAGGNEEWPPEPDHFYNFYGPSWEAHREADAFAHYFVRSRALAAQSNGDLVLSEGDRILRATFDGWVQQVAGNVTGNPDPGYQDPNPGPFFSGDGCPATGLPSWADCPGGGGEIAINGGKMGATPSGALIFADTGNQRIRMVDEGGTILTLAGTGIASSSVGGATGDQGYATQACFEDPADAVALPDDSLLVLDAGNKRVRKTGDPLEADQEQRQDQTIQIPSEGGGEIYVFDVEGRHLRTVEARTNTALLSFGYDTAGYLISLTDAFGHVTTIDRDLNHDATRIVGPFGHITRLTVGAGGYLTSVKDPANHTTSLAYDQDGLLTQLTDPLGHATHFSYDSLGRLLHDEDPLGGSTSLARTELAPDQKRARGFEVVKSTALGRSTLYRTEKLTDGGERRTITSPDGTTLLVEEANDHSRRTTYPDGTIATLTPKADPRFGVLTPLIETASVTLPSGLSSTTSTSRTVGRVSPLVPGTAPSDAINLLHATDTVTVDGRTTTSGYDFNTRTLTVTTAAGRSSTATTDVYGRLVAASSPGFAATTYAYDSDGRLASATQGGRTTTYLYNQQGFLASVTDPLGRQVQLSYDLVGQVTSQTLPDGRQVSYQYDAAGNLLSIAPPSRPAHGFSYDAAGQGTLYSPPDLGAGTWSTTYAYNLDHQPTSISRPDGQVITLAYDPAKGRLLSVTTPLGATTPSYDPVTGNVTSITDPSGGSLAFSYDGSLPLAVTWSGAVSGSVAATYNNHFEAITQTVTGSDGPHTTSYSYDLDGAVTQAGSLSLAYDGATGLPTTSALGSVTDELHFTSYGELSSYLARYDADPLLSASYTRDDGGRIVARTEAVLGGSLDSYLYTYDLAGRLSAVSKNAVPAESFSYDANGNRTSWTDAWGSHTATYDAQDRLLTLDGLSFTYSANGELLAKTDGTTTATYTYDATGALLGASLPGGISLDYVLDAAGRRVGKKVNGTLAQGFLYAGSSPVAELDAAGNVVSLFVYGRKGHVPEVLIKNGTEYRLITDHLGSVRLVVDATTGTVAQRVDYSAFGRVLFDSNPGFQPFGFAGGLYDTHTGLVHFGAREYDPELGRWTSKDPIGFGGGDTNLYGYVVGDPVNLTDPSGLAPPPPVGQPLPPGWEPSWEWRYPEGTAPAGPRWFDPEGGEWRWHQDRWHTEGHWDHNPWDEWNSKWKNVPHDQCPGLPETVEPEPTPVPWWVRLRSLFRSPLLITANPCLVVPSLCQTPGPTVDG